MNRRALFLSLVLGLPWPALAWADGLGVDKVYSPLVESLVTELEYRTLWYPDAEGEENLQQHQLAFGRSLADKWYAEIYVSGLQQGSGPVKQDGYAVESRWQLTEQGEYAWDAGVLVELETEDNNRAHEASTALLLEQAGLRQVFTANLFLIIEDLPEQPVEVESALNLQWRYRYRPWLEPAIETYLSQATTGIGPVLMGEIRPGLRRKLHWELGYIAEIREGDPTYVVRGLLEFEF